MKTITENLKKLWNKLSLDYILVLVIGIVLWIILSTLGVKKLGFDLFYTAMVAFITLNAVRIWDLIEEALELDKKWVQFQDWLKSIWS